MQISEQNFTMRYLTRKAKSNPEWPGLGAVVMTKGKTAAASPLKRDYGHNHHRFC